MQGLCEKGLQRGNDNLFQESVAVKTQAKGSKAGWQEEESTGKKRI
jgi:hypothetical protein